MTDDNATECRRTSSIKKLAATAIKNGARPDYVALRYGLPVKLMEYWAEQWQQRIKANAEARAARGGRGNRGA